MAIKKDFNKLEDLYMNFFLYSDIWCILKYQKKKKDIKKLEKFFLKEEILNLKNKANERYKKILNSKLKKNNMNSIEKIESIKKENIDVVCPYCNYQELSSFIMLDEHIMKYHRKKWNINSSQRCKTCGIFIDKSKYLEHTMSCSKQNNSVQSKSKEVNTLEKKDKQKIICKYCEVLVNKKNYEKHLKKCPKFSSKRINNLSVQSKTLSVNKFKCRYCSHFLSSYEELDRHENKHSENDKNKFLIKEKDNTKNKTNNLMTCEYCRVSVNKKNYRKHLNKCPKKNNKIIEKEVIKKKEKSISKEKLWEQSSLIKEIEEERITLTNIEKHQSIKYQFREDEELDPDLIDEEEYQKTFGIELDAKSQRVRDRVAFEHAKVYYKEEEEDKSEIKIFLSKMYKGYCQVCGYTFRKTDGKNSFERFNWNDKRVVKVKKNLVSTADSLCLCRNCSANIKWGAFYPNFVDTIREIEEFKSKSYDEVREKLHKVVDEDIPKVFDFHLHEDVYALEIELDGKPRNIYFTNEHLLQFVTYLQKEDEVEEEVIEKRRVKERKSKIDSLSSRIYSSHVWLKREETIPKYLAQDFIRNSAWWLTHPSGAVRARNHAYNVYKNEVHGWAIDFGANKFLVGKAIERCKNEINNYIKEFRGGTKSIEIDSLKFKLKKHISGAVATYNNGEYSGYYPIVGNDLEFGSQAINVNDGANFLIQELGLVEFLEI